MSKNIIPKGSRVAVSYNETASEGPAVFFGELVYPVYNPGEPLIIRMESNGLLTELNPNASSFEGITEAPKSEPE